MDDKVDEDDDADNLLTLTFCKTHPNINKIPFTLIRLKKYNTEYIFIKMYWGTIPLYLPQLQNLQEGPRLQVPSETLPNNTDCILLPVFPGTSESTTRTLLL